MTRSPQDTLHLALAKAQDLAVLAESASIAAQAARNSLQSAHALSRRAADPCCAAVDSATRALADTSQRLAASGAALDAAALETDAASVQAADWQARSRAAAPRPRPPGLLDMPDAVLCRIFDFVEYSEKWVCVEDDFSTFRPLPMFPSVKMMPVASTCRRLYHFYREAYVQGIVVSAIIRPVDEMIAFRKLVRAALARFTFANEIHVINCDLVSSLLVDSTRVKALKEALEYPHQPLCEVLLDGAKRGRGREVKKIGFYNVSGEALHLQGCTDYVKNAFQFLPSPPNDAWSGAHWATHFPNVSCVDVQLDGEGQYYFQNGIVLSAAMRWKGLKSFFINFAHPESGEAAAEHLAEAATSEFINSLAVLAVYNIQGFGRRFQAFVRSLPNLRKLELGFASVCSPSLVNTINALDNAEELCLYRFRASPDVHPATETAARLQFEDSCPRWHLKRHGDLGEESHVYQRARP